MLELFVEWLDDCTWSEFFLAQAAAAVALAWILAKASNLIDRIIYRKGGPL